MARRLWGFIFDISKRFKAFVDIDQRRGERKRGEDEEEGEDGVAHGASIQDQKLKIGLEFGENRSGRQLELKGPLVDRTKGKKQRKQETSGSVERKKRKKKRRRKKKLFTINQSLSINAGHPQSVTARSK